MTRQFFRDVGLYGLRVAWHNFRFCLGYAVGGFTSARRRATR